jgi:hypothetical protein
MSFTLFWFEIVNLIAFDKIKLGLGWSDDQISQPKHKKIETTFSQVQKYYNISHNSKVSLLVLIL